MLKIRKNKREYKTMYYSKVKKGIENKLKK